MINVKLAKASSYVAPESPSTDAFTEETDVYSFGILVMEIISGLIPVDSRQPQVQIPNFGTFCSFSYNFFNTLFNICFYFFPSPSHILGCEYVWIFALQPYLIEWFKSMVANREISCVVDPKLPEMPSLKGLKRIILVALRCVDPNINHRPKMGDVVHMLEQCDMLLNNVRTICFF